MYRGSLVRALLVRGLQRGAQADSLFGIGRICSGGVLCDSEGLLHHDLTTINCEIALRRYISKMAWIGYLLSAKGWKGKWRRADLGCLVSLYVLGGQIYNYPLITLCTTISRDVQPILEQCQPVEI